MLIFIDMAMIGGVSAVLYPNAKANHAGCGKKVYNSNLPFNWILYVDANNLYGWAMLQYLPTGGFEWVDVTERENWGEFILQQEDESPVGYMLEVDLEYPDELHDSHDNFPCAPERMFIKKEYLSDTQKLMGEQVREKYKSEKLCLTLENKVEYKLQYRNLKQYMKLG